MNELGNKKGAWLRLVEYIEKNYDHEPVMKQEGKDAAWTIRYRRGGKTLVTLYPKKGEFVVLVVLGKEEVARAKGAKLGSSVKNIFDRAKQYHDGRWLWIRPKYESDFRNVVSLLAVKRKPRMDNKTKV